jgi:ribosome maturation factor RimP
MDLLDRVHDIIEPAIEAMGYELVRVHHSGGRRPVLQVMVERADRVPMNVDDCAEVSRAVSAVLDVEDPIPGEYVLEVSSPGIDRPLTRLADFERFAGFEAKVETEAPVEGRKRFRGRLDGVAENRVRLLVDAGGTMQTVALPFGTIRRARLVLTDDLIAASGGGPN